jgi:septum formation protein
VTTTLRGRLVLASASPRRRALFDQVGLVAEVVPAEVDESALPGEPPEAMAVRLALSKARAVVSNLGAGRRDVFVVGADTIVVVGGIPLGKPTDDVDAARMIGRLGGRTHHVVTGVAVLDVAGEREETTTSMTAVRMRPIDERAARAYVATGEGRDKAGGYAIQGIASGFVESIEGSYSNVVGLPLVETLRLLGRVGALEDWP